MMDKDIFFGTGSFKTEIIGKIFCNQMYLGEDKWILPRINPKCEKCNNNDNYNINRSTPIKVIYLPVIKNDVRYSITCSSCKETIELDFDEYLIIEPLIKINRKYAEGKISEREHEMKVQDILGKILKKME